MNFTHYPRELFEDSNEILTGPIENENHQLVGINLWGATLGAEFRPVDSGFIRLEAQHFQTSANETIFHYHSQGSATRNEFIAALGAWF